MRLAKWAVLWAALVALSSAPALAQDAVGGGDGTDTGGDVQIVDCPQVVNAAQVQYGDATAIGDGAVAVIANEQSITVNQVNACLGNIGGGEETTTGDTTTGDTTTGDTTTGDTTDGVIASTVPEVDELPETGGSSGIALAAGCALLGVGLIINRIFR